MHFSTLILATALATVTTTTPIDLPSKRAGGPSITPIPSNCTITNPLSGFTNTNTTRISGYRPSTNFTNTHEIYSSYFDATLNQTAEIEQCLEQCYGYGEGECKAAMLAYDVGVPEGYYGAPGGELATACLMYDQYLCAKDFVMVDDGGWVNETVGNIYC